MSDIRHSIAVEAPSDRVKHLVSMAAGFAAWWAEDVREVSGATVVELFTKCGMASGAAGVS